MKLLTESNTSVKADALLSLAEMHRLEKLEERIRNGMDTVMEVAEALVEINTKRLYRATHPTFEAYCRERWDINRSRSYQLMEAARVKEALPAQLSKKLDNDSQFRVLAGVPEDQRGKVVEITIERMVEAGKTRPTAKMLKKVAHEFSPTVVEDRAKPRMTACRRMLRALDAWARREAEELASADFKAILKQVRSLVAETL
jgi:hypothetical protein